MSIFKMQETTRKGNVICFLNKCGFFLVPRHKKITKLYPFFLKEYSRYPKIKY